MLLEDKYIDFLIENDITQNQYLLLHLIFKQRLDLIQKYKNHFPTDDKTMIGQYFITDLYKKGFLENTQINGKTVIRVTEKFLSIIIDKHIAAEQIYEIYPSYMESNGNHIPLTSMDRNIFAQIYNEAILSNVKEHLEVLEDIKYGIEHKLLNLGIEKFVKSKYWLTIRKLRINDSIKVQENTIMDNNF